MIILIWFLHSVYRACTPALPTDRYRLFLLTPFYFVIVCVCMGVCVHAICICIVCDTMYYMHTYFDRPIPFYLFHLLCSFSLKFHNVCISNNTLSNVALCVAYYTSRNINEQEETGCDWDLELCHGIIWVWEVSKDKWGRVFCFFICLVSICCFCVLFISKH